MSGKTEKPRVNPEKVMELAAFASRLEGQALRDFLAGKKFQKVLSS